ncbi:MAG: alpha/beta hydrolase [Bacteroidota bacterium]
MADISPYFEAHQQAGRFFEASGVKSFVREEGNGEVVVCLHGVPTSSYLYRKLLPELASRGFRGIAFDFPGLGLADRPINFDYSWTGLGKWTTEAIAALGLGNFHLILHDIGGPIGLEMVHQIPNSMLSLTILNAPIAGVGSFQKPWVMRPFEKKRVGELYLGTMRKKLFVQLMYMQGIQDKKLSPPEELYVYIDLLKRQDGGKAFLQIMRNFEPTLEKETLYMDTLKALDVPIQVIWGEFDPTLTLNQYGLPLQEALELPEIHTLPAKHFLQEDQAPKIAQLFSELVD